MNNKLVEKIVYNTYNFCCLCLKHFDSDENFSNIADEVVLDHNDTRDLFFILSYIFRDLMFDEIITTFSLLCHSCTETAIKSYKYTKMCRDNVIRLSNIVENLNNYLEENYFEVNRETPLKLFLHNKTVNEIYDDNLNKYCLKTQVKKEYVPDRIENEQSVEYPGYYEFENDTNLISERRSKQNLKTTSFGSNNEEIRDKTDLSVFKCKMCKNIYSRGPNLKKHYLNIHAPKIYKCLRCKESFGSALLLKSHEKNRHTQSMKCCCIECGKVYNTTYSLQNHEMRHKLKLVCQHCGKVYKTKQAFKSHIHWNHSGLSKIKLKFICDHCGKSYSQKSGLRLHIRFEHGNGKYYECDWCKKRLSSQSHLKEHLQTHTKEKPFSCKFCNGRFSTKMCLVYHTRRHTGEKPYKCNYCDSRFISASQRLSHVKQHHLPPGLQCDICSKEFKLKNCLRKHRLKHFDSKSKLHKEL